MAVYTRADDCAVLTRPALCKTNADGSEELFWFYGEYAMTISGYYNPDGSRRMLKINDQEFDSKAKLYWDGKTLKVDISDK